MRSDCVKELNERCADETSVKKDLIVAEKSTKEDACKVAWRNFTSAFKDRDQHSPFPSLELGSSFSEEDVNLLLADESMKAGRLLRSCTDAANRKRIADEFLSSFPETKSVWNVASILLTADADTTYWIAGDVHAKVSAIAKICAVITDRHRRNLTKQRNVLILLGDYIDRGDEPLETLAYIEFLKCEPLFEGFEVITLKGNHDAGLSRSADGNYVSMVSPAETAEQFSALTSDGADISIEADAAMRLASVSPRMCELTGIDPNRKSATIMCVHGGVPHIDHQEKLYQLRNNIEQNKSFFSALNNEMIPEELRRGCAEDFTWVRFSKDLPFKQPNRGSRGCEIGTEDVAQYLSLHRVLTSRDITFIFRGHDHERRGFACYSPHPELNPTKKKFAQKDCHVLTLNSMEPDYSSGGMFRERDIALAEWSMGNPVRLHRIATHHLEVPITKTPVNEEEVLPEPPKEMLDGVGMPPMIQPEDIMKPMPIKLITVQEQPAKEETEVK